MAGQRCIALAQTRIDFRRVNNRGLNFFVSRPNFVSLPNFASNAGGIVVDNAVFCLSIARSVPEIFAIKVKSLKLSEIAPNYGCFWPPFLGEGPQISGPGL